MVWSILRSSKERGGNVLYVDHLWGQPVVGHAVRSGRLRAITGGALLGALAIVASFLASASAYASSTYIVDGTNPSCSDTAVGAGSASQPFCTIAGAAKKAQPGYTVSVIAGTYSGTAVNPANSGTAGSPITFTASPGVTISGGTKAFALSGKNYIVISGFTITGTSSYGIYVSGGSNDTVSGNTLTGTGSHAIYLSGGGNNTVSGNTESRAGTPQQGLSAYGIWLKNESQDQVKGNITHDNSAHGIYLSGTTTGALVQGNTSYHNAYQWERNANGINDIAPGNSIIGNVTYANEDSGINIYTGGDNALVAENVTYGNGDHGIDDLNVTGGRLIGNTVYGNCSDGINVEGTSSNYLIENNISDNNATGAEVKPTIVNYSPYKTCAQRRKGNIGVYDQTAPGTTTADYNLAYQTGSAPDFIWGTASYTSRQGICQATGQECHGNVADPRFVNAGAGDFRLTAGSPAIDQANTAASGQQPTDILGVSPYDDMGAYEYAGGGS
jgi:parallel beta-helix repeat protein